jgi:hypothetical protein
MARMGAGMAASDALSRLAVEGGACEAGGGGSVASMHMVMGSGSASRKVCMAKGELSSGCGG